MSEKPKLAVFWASSCGGCEIAIVNLHERLLAVDEHLELVFCPCLMDTKTVDVEAMPDGSIAITLFNGAIRTDENEEMARLLRRKSQTLIAFGACSSGGGIPALSNLHRRQDHLRTIYLDNPSIANLAGTVPESRSRVPEGELELSEFYEAVKHLGQVVDVDYFIPGCPPESHQIWNVLEAVISGRPLPPKGSVLGGGRSSVCQECGRAKAEKRISRFYRPYEIIPVPVECLLEQGLVCMGIATRDGCGARCPQVNMPCTGCYGPPEGVRDQGAKMIAALGSVLDTGKHEGLSDEEIETRIDAVLETIPDTAGVFYKYNLSGSLLGGRKR